MLSLISYISDASNIMYIHKVVFTDNGFREMVLWMAEILLSVLHLIFKRLIRNNYSSGKSQHPFKLHILRVIAN